MKKTAIVIGVAFELLGGLWLLQGLGVVHVKPILCFANCAPVQGASLTWAIVGIITVAIGSAALFYSRKRS